MARNRGYGYREQVGPRAAGHTLLSYLTMMRPHSTGQEWADRIARGEVEVDECVATPDVLLRPGQQVTWHRPPWEEPDVPLHYDLLHEDEDILAVVKPSGLPTMPAGGFLEHTLMTQVRVRYPTARPMHRLGRFTSGIVLFAQTTRAAATLARAWREHAVRKQYRAIASGSPRWHERSIDAPIGRVPHPLLGLVYAASADGKPSRSVVRVRERRGDDCVVDVQITTGRPHQIRIHLAYEGHPLVGDPLYDIGGVPKANQPGLPGEGGYLLHAERLRFAHPVTAEMIEFIAPPPDAFR
jgi:23S rRNA pseudouridine1911/1915/1917 synthase